MSEYIKRNVALDAMRDVMKQARHLRPPLYDAIDNVKNLPSADVVEVVRCKYCKYSRVADTDDQEDGYLCSLLHGHEFFSYDYCSYGERKGQENE